MVNTTLLSYRYKPPCALCGLASETDLALCQECRACLIPNTHACPRCALPFAPGHLPDATCGQCQIRPPPFSRSVAPWRYEPHISYLIKQWKYAGAAWLSRLLAALWLAQTPDDLTAADLIVPVPLHWRRRWQRGYNQSLLLAEALIAQSDNLNRQQLRSRSLYRQRHTAVQSSLDAPARRHNLDNAFAVRGRFHGEHIALIDDVMTTGSTATQAAAALLDRGADGVSVWVIARALLE